MVTIDPKAVEAARVAIIDAVKSSYAKWKKVAVTVKAAWPTQGLLDEPMVRQWIIDAMGATELLATPRGETAADKIKDRDSAQATAKKFFNDVVKYAYPAPVVVQPAPELTPEQAEAKAAQIIATQAAIDKGEAVKAAADAEANKKIAAAEAKAAELKAKQAAAAAALDATQAEAAAIAQAEAEAKAAIAEEQAEAAEQAKAEAEEAKAAMVAAQADAKAKADAIQSAKCAEAILSDINVLLARVKGYKDKIKGAEDLEAGLIGLRTDFKLDNGLI
jgi:hypothetical protein